MKLSKALLVVDVQNDFCPKGKLAVFKGDAVVAPLNRYIRLFARKELPIFFSRDWHPKKTHHFRSFGGQWPVHCVQNTQGARFHPKLSIPKEAILISKGIDSSQDGYSAFQGADVNNAALEHLLKMFGVTELFIGGLATDYCVKYSALDARRLGFKVRLLIDAVRGVNLKASDSTDAVKEMKRSGVKVMEYATVKGLFV
jgi:nicotinamidase/pyrazinamidase